MSCRLLSCLKLLFLPLVLMLICQNRLYGAEEEVTPIFSIKEEYNDNIFFADDDDITDEEEDFITTLSAGLRLLHRSEKSELLFNGRFDRLIYGENDSLNDHENFLNGNASFDITPHFRLLAGADYQRRTRRDRELDEAGLLVNTNEPSYRQHYGIGGEYTLTENTQFSLGYYFDRNDYDDPGSYDTKYHGVDFGLYHFLSAQTIGRLILGFVTYDLSNSVDALLPGIFPGPEGPIPGFAAGVVRDESTIDNYSFTLGASHAITELFTILVDVGTRYTTSDRDQSFLVPPPIISLTPDIETDDDGWGTVGQVRIDYRDERNSASLAAYRDISAASGSYGATERTTVGIQAGRRLTEHLSSNISLQYFWNESDAGEISLQEVDEETFTITPLVRYAITDDLDLEAQYQYVRLEDNEDDTDANRSLIFLRLVYEFPLLD